MLHSKKVDDKDASAARRCQAPENGGDDTSDDGKWLAILTKGWLGIYDEHFFSFAPKESGGD